MITTYNGTENEYYDFEKDVLEGKKPYGRHFTTFREAVTQGLYKRICLVQGKTWTQDAEDEWVATTYKEFGDKAEQELDCIPKNSGGRYFPLILIEQAMKSESPILTLERPDSFAILPANQREKDIQDWLDENVRPVLSLLNPDRKTYVGEDFARKGDLSIVLVLEEQVDLVRRSVLGLELRNIPFEQQRQIFLDKCSTPESVTRTRRNLRSQYPGNKEVEEGRYKKFNDYRQGDFF